jgi:hypothetical protein
MMSTVKAFHHRRQHAPSGPPPRPAAATDGKVELVDGGNLPSVHTPNDADIFKAIGELGKKIHQLSKNQQAIEAKLNHITARVAAVDANLIIGVQYLEKVMNSIGWWASGDQDTAEQTWPPNPHWK